ncbi:uncharacterized protein KY384_007049 [Bacidia gigantensis]|uniref:uncharacterized protein n=1 Tax=Bacidia gigantensis TaxID=2732470 RepID=UPI001D04D3EB|nr:uncharacterized protein KY384_007049 [Bacidia gigantensis]KAG8528133.1 hypothetical protein KY384_007049 [Bacidia gigantensis]
MADVTTPSAIAMSTINAGADPVQKPTKTKPEKPDEAAYKENLSQADKVLQVSQEKFNALKAKIDAAQPRNTDSPSSKRAQELKSELGSIRQQQSGFKSSRGSVQDKIGALDAQLKSRINEQKTKRSQVPYKSVEEIDRAIQQQEKIAESSTATLVDQKKAIAEQSSLRKQRKAFGTFEDAQRGIDGVKSQIAELKKSLDNPEARALSQRYDQIDKELKAIRAEQDGAYKSLSSLRDEQSKAYADKQEKLKTVKEIKDHYYKAKSAHRDYEQEQYRIRQAKEKEEREAYFKEKRRKVAEQKLEEASQPAYADEILTAEHLIRYFDPTSSEASKPLRAPSGFAAEALRSVDANLEFKGMKVVKKDDHENYFIGGGGKKGKKGKKGSSAASPAPATPTEGKFNLSIGIIENLAKVNVEPPMSQSDVPTVLERLRERKAKWKDEQDGKTKENIAKAQKEIDRLEAEAKESHSSSTANRRTHDVAKKPSIANQSVNGTANASAELAQENDAADDVVKDLKEASIEERTEA